MYIDDNARMLPVLEACAAAVPRDSREHLRGRQNLACLFYSLEHRAHHRHVVADLSRELGRYVGWSFKNKKKEWYACLYHKRHNTGFEGHWRRPGTPLARAVQELVKTIFHGGI